jgi:hypothetical protein
MCARTSVSSDGGSTHPETSVFFGAVSQKAIIFILSPSSGLKMETYFSKMLVSADESTWHENPEVQHHHHHPNHCDILRFHNVK